MKFDWLKFCTKNSVPYVTSGPNTARGNISIHCPWCMDQDPSEHMGLSLDLNRPFWGCFRNHEHRGQHPARLVAKILGISSRAAYTMLDIVAPDLDEFEASVASLTTPPPPDEWRAATYRPPHITMPDEFRTFDLPGPYRNRFTQYLADDRGFLSGAEQVAKAAGLRYCLSGRQAWRIIFPVHDLLTGALVGWQGRSIMDKAPQRYIGMEGMGKDHIYWPMRNFDPIVICEGPFDALKLSWFGNACAYATLGTSVTEGQLTLLRRLCRGHRATVVFDKAAMAEGLYLAGELDAEWRPVPARYSDPGAMDAQAVHDFCASLK